MITAVFDCMIFLQAATNDRGPAFACLALVEAKLVRLFLSPAILAEIRDVLTRPKIRTRFSHLTQERVELFIQKIAAMAVLADEPPDAGVSLRDPGDLPYLNLAAAEKAEYLVSRDKDLLVLATDTTFTRTFPQMRIVGPIDFLEAVRATRAP